MATYKVIQDIESEDKLLGPFTLRQFIYAAIVAIMGFVAFKLAFISIFLVIPFILPMGFFALLAAPFGHDQSSEVWLLAKIGFMLKPRRRIWDQTGMRELVTITVPKKVEKYLTDGLTQNEVKSRLQALANTIDSRGWAVKNVNLNMYNPASYMVTASNDSDRLVAGNSLPQSVPTTDVYAADDMLDENNNPTAQHLKAMINQSEQVHRETVVATVQNGQKPTNPPADYWFMNQTSPPSKPKDGNAMFDGGPTTLPGSAPINSPASSVTGDAEQKLLERIHLEDTKPNPAYGHMRVLDPSGTKRVKKQLSSKLSPSPKPPAQDPQLSRGRAEIARLAGNDDLNIATLAREADKAAKQFPEDEVVVSLR